MIPINETVTLGALFRDQRTAEVENIIKAELILFADIISVANNISLKKAERMAEMFIAIPEVKQLRIEELKLFFQEAFAFNYGKLYGGFGWDSLREWFSLYWKQRITTAVEIQLNNHSQNTANEKSPRFLEDRFGNNENHSISKYLKK